MSQSKRPAELPPVLRQFCVVVVVLTALSLLYCLGMKVLLHRQYPYVWPLFPADIRFNDFTIYQDKFRLFHQAAFFTTGWVFTYPAPPAIAFEAFFYLGRSHALGLFLTFALLAFAVPAVLFWRALVRRGVAASSALGLVLVATLLSWPVWLVIDRGNIEVLVWVVLCIATWAYARGKEWTAATMFGVAASLKLFPFVYLALFFTRRKFPKMLWGAVVFGLVTLLSLALLGPTVSEAYRGISNGLTFFHNTYMAQFHSSEQGVDHSLLAFIKVMIYLLMGHFNRPHLVALALRVYVPLTAIGGLVLYFARIRKLPWLNQLMILSIVSIYITPYSGDGTLLHLYYGFVPLCFLAVDAWRRGLRIPGLKTAMMMFGYLLATESFIIVKALRFEGQVKCIALGVLLVCALRYPFGAPRSLEEDGPTFANPDASKVEDAVPLEGALQTAALS